MKLGKYELILTKEVTYITRNHPTKNSGEFLEWLAEELTEDWNNITKIEIDYEKVIVKVERKAKIRGER